MEDPNKSHLWHYMKDGHEILLCLYVDDFLVAAANDQVFDAFVQFLQSKFAIGTAEPVSFFLVSIFART